MFTKPYLRTGGSPRSSRSFPNLIQVTDSCSCHCPPGTWGVPGLHRSSQHLPLNCNRRPRSRFISYDLHFTSLHFTTRSWAGANKGLDASWGAGVESLEKFLVVSLSFIPGGGNRWAGGQAQRPICCLKGFYSSHVPPSWPSMNGYLKLYESLSLAPIERPISWACAWASVAIPAQVQMPSCWSWEPQSNRVNSSWESLVHGANFSLPFLQESAFVQIFVRTPGDSPPSSDLRNQRPRVILKWI